MPQVLYFIVVFLYLILFPLIKLGVWQMYI